MKKKNIVIVSLIVFVSISIVGVAGVVNFFSKRNSGEKFVDGKEELKKLYLFFMNPDITYDVHGTIYLYDKESGGKLAEKASFSSYKSKEGCYLQMGSLKTFLYKAISLQVDTVQKFIIVKELNDDVLSTPFGGIDFGKVVDDSGFLHIRAKYIDRSVDERELIIENDYSPEIKQIVIFYNPSNFHISKTEIKWWKNSFPSQDEDNGDCWLTKTEITYSYPQEHSIKKEIEKFVVHDGKGYSTAPAYNTYKFDFLPVLDEETN